METISDFNNALSALEYFKQDGFYPMAKDIKTSTETPNCLPGPKNEKKSLDLFNS